VPSPSFAPREISERRRVTIRGLVQGVFFRETVRQIARHHPVDGFVRNAARDRVEIEAEGEGAAIDAFIADVIAHPPPAARVDAVDTVALIPTGERGFTVAPTT
jgi:acylphosphatase